MKRLHNSIILLALTAACLATAGASLTALGHLKDAAIAASLNGRSLGLGLLGALRPLDLLFLLLSALTVLALAGLEWRRRGLTTFLHTATPAQAFGLLTLLLIWTGHAYLFPGLQLGGDTASHVVRFNEIARGLQSGVLPDWTNYGYIGEPLLWFTGPLTYVVGGALAVLTHSANLALKLLLFVTHIFAGWTMWALLRRFGVGPLAAAIASACTFGAFADLHLFLYRGETPQTLTMVFIVLLFFAADGLMRGIGRLWLNFLIFALTTAALIVNHQPHAIFTAIYLLVFAVIAIATGFWRLRLAPPLILAGVLGAVASLVAVIPVLFESDWVMIEPEGAMVGANAPTVSRLLLLAKWHNTLTSRGNEYWAYIGFGMLLLLFCGLVGLALRRLNRPAGQAALPALACLVVSMFLHNPVVRDILYVLFFAGILAALGLDWLQHRPILAGRRLLALIGLIVLDLVSTAIQPVARTDKANQLEGGRYLETNAPNERVLQIGIDPKGKLSADMGPDGAIMSYSSLVQRIAGNHNMAATRVHNFLAVTIKAAEAELQADGKLTPETMTALGLFNVTRIYCTTALANGCPDTFANLSVSPVLGRYVPIPATPALFSPALTTLALPPGLDKPMVWENHFDEPARGARLTAIGDAVQQFITAEAIDIATRTAGAIALQTPAETQSTAAPAGQFTIKDYAVDLQSVSLRIDAPFAGFVQLSHPWIPSTVVTLNGVPVEPLRGTIGLLVVRVPAGESVIALTEGGTFARRASMLLSALGLIAIFTATILAARRRVA